MTYIQQTEQIRMITTHCKVTYALKSLDDNKRTIRIVNTLRYISPNLKYILFDAINHDIV